MAVAALFGGAQGLAHVGSSPALLFNRLARLHTGVVISSCIMSSISSGTSMCWYHTLDTVQQNPRLRQAPPATQDPKYTEIMTKSACTIDKYSHRYKRRIASTRRHGIPKWCSDHKETEEVLTVELGGGSCDTIFDDHGDTILNFAGLTCA